MSCKSSDPCICEKISGIATGQILELAGKKCTAKGCFDVQNTDFEERLSIFRHFLSEKDLVIFDIKAM